MISPVNVRAMRSGAYHLRGGRERARLVSAVVAHGAVLRRRLPRQLKVSPISVVNQRCMSW